MIQSGTNISIDTGSEGPSWDPYGYHEITVKRFGRSVTLHTGLAVWLKRDGEKVSDDFSEEELFELFEQWTGMHPHDAMKYERQAREVCSRCFHRGSVSLGGGFAGETIYGCPVCGQIMYDDFHPSMIE